MDNINFGDALFKLTGHTPQELYNGIKELQEEFLLDDRNEDNYTVPLIEQLRARLENLEICEEDLKTQRQITDIWKEKYFKSQDKVREVEAERDYYKYEYEIRIR